VEHSLACHFERVVQYTRFLRVHFIRRDLAARRLRLGTMLQFDQMRTELAQTYIEALLEILIGDRVRTAFVRIAGTAADEDYYGNCGQAPW